MILGIDRLMHSSESGADHLALDDKHAIAISRGIIGVLGNAGRTLDVVVQSNISQKLAFEKTICMIYVLPLATPATKI